MIGLDPPAAVHRMCARAKPQYAQLPLLRHCDWRVVELLSIFVRFLVRHPPSNSQLDHIDHVR